jgi:hypothetical protein
LNLALKMAQRLTAIASEGEGKELAGALHAQAALSLILQADVDAAMELHARAKRVDGSVIPPLAQQHLDGRSCGGLGDLFYVSAVMIKQLLDARNKTPSVEYNTTLHEGFTTLVTLTADSGLHGAAEAAMSKALQNRPNDASLLFRAALLTPGVFENDEHLRSTRARLSARIHDLHARTHPPPAIQGPSPSIESTSSPCLPPFTLSTRATTTARCWKCFTTATLRPTPTSTLPSSPLLQRGASSNNSSSTRRRKFE